MSIIRNIILIFSLCCFMNCGLAASDSKKPTNQPLLHFIDFHCFGTEPFWNLTLTATGFKFKVPQLNNEANTSNSKTVNLKAVTPLHAEGMKEGFLRVYQTQASSNHQAATILIRDNPEGCTDGMSEELHGYNSVVILQNKVYAGCCNLASDERKSP